MGYLSKRVRDKQVVYEVQPDKGINLQRNGHNTLFMYLDRVTYVLYVLILFYITPCVRFVTKEKPPISVRVIIITDGNKIKYLKRTQLIISRQ